jgi:DNA-binding CsgD family transcriptional regulator
MTTAEPCLTCGEPVPVGHECPLCRALEVQEWIERGSDDVESALLARARHMAQLVAEGMPRANIADLYGVSGPRVSQILAAHRRLETFKTVVLAGYSHL